MQKKTNERFYGEDDCLLNTLTDNVAEHGGVYSRFKRKMKNGAVFRSSGSCPTEKVRIQLPSGTYPIALEFH